MILKKKKYCSFCCNKCKIRWKTNKIIRVSKCYYCKNDVYKVGYYYFYCDLCKKTWRKYIKWNKTSFCYGCKQLIKINLKKKIKKKKCPKKII